MPSPFAMRSTRSGLAGSLLATVSTPGLAPDADGVKVTLMVQLPCAATAVPQLFEVV